MKQENKMKVWFELDISFLFYVHLSFDKINF